MSAGCFVALIFCRAASAFFLFLHSFEKGQCHFMDDIDILGGVTFTS